MPQYDEYATVYDATGQLQFSLRMLDYLDDLLARHTAPGCDMIDLACGTGTLAIGMAEKGWAVQGVDLSEKMLAQARSKPGSQAVKWRQGDMRNLTVDRQASLVTCIYDSMNYMLSDGDMARTFGSVAKALEPGGLFVFDMNTIAQMEEVDGQSYVTESDGATVIMECARDTLTSQTTITMTCFQQKGELYRRFREVHVEQAYPTEHVATLLADAGFVVEGVYDCMTLDPPDDDTPRVLFCARSSARSRRAHLTGAPDETSMNS